MRQRCYIIPHLTIDLLPEFEANWPKNDRVIEWAPFWGWRRRKWQRGATYGGVEMRRCCYLIPHPTNYLLSKFEANWPKNDSFWMGAILRVAPPEMAPQRRLRRCSVAALFLHQSPSSSRNRIFPTLPSFAIEKDTVCSSRHIKPTKPHCLFSSIEFSSVTNRHLDTVINDHSSFTQTIVIHLFTFLFLYLFWPDLVHCKI